MSLLNGGAERVRSKGVPTPVCCASSRDTAEGQRSGTETGTEGDAAPHLNTQRKTETLAK